MKKPTKQNVGNIGEYYLASILSARNCVVSITLGRAEIFDLLVLNPKNHTVRISVKTRFHESDFPYNKKSELDENICNDLFYAFIEYKEGDTFDYWILTSKELYEYSQYVSEKYFAEPKRDGTPKKKSSFRKICFSNHEAKYKPPDWEEKMKKYYKNLERILEY